MDARLRRLRVQSVNRPFSFTVTIVDGTLPKSKLHLKNRPVLQVCNSPYLQLPQLDLYLSAQLQRFEDSASDSLEFEHLKEHFEPFLRTSSLSSSIHLPAPSSHHTRTSSITAAASAALARDIPGVGKYNALGRNRAGKDKSANKDEMPEYQSRVQTGIGGGIDTDTEFIRHIEDIGQVASLEQRWVNSWKTSLRTKYVSFSPSIYFFSFFQLGI